MTSDTAVAAPKNIVEEPSFDELIQGDSTNTPEPEGYFPAHVIKDSVGHVTALFVNQKETDD